LREVDFLPAWYPAIQRKYRMVVVQAWASLAVVIVLVIYAAAKRWEVYSARQTTAICQAQINLSQKQVDELNQKLKYEQQLAQQDQIVAKLGLGVDATRLIAVLEDAMTPGMALTNLSMEMVETPRAMQIGFIGRSRSSENGSADVDRSLKVQLEGVAPSAIDVATLIAKLNDVKFFENVSFPYIRQGQTRDGHIAQEFQVTFDLNLNAPAEGK
jgi:Tfp pilus assembly protein PilN